MTLVNNWFSLEKDSEKNLITITFESSATNSEFDNYLEQYKNLYNRNEIFTVIFDARKISNLSPSQIFKKAALMQSMKAIHKKHLKHFYVIANSKYTLNIIKSMFSIIKPVVPYNIYNTIEEISIL
jgi:cytochrome c biogenesis factor